MAEVRWTSQAADDLEAIAEFIGKNSHQYAELFVIDVLRAVEGLVDFPRMGRVVPEVGDSHIREVILGNYRMIYRIRGGAIEILTLFHGARFLDSDHLQ